MFVFGGLIFVRWFVCLVVVFMLNVYVVMCIALEGVKGGEWCFCCQLFVCCCCCLIAVVGVRVVVLC